MNSFGTFRKEWLDKLKKIMEELYKARRPPTTQDEDNHLRHLVSKVTTHYIEYYRVKSLVVEHDVLSLFTAPWATSLEKAFQWMAGWRPTSVFHLIYTESSFQFETRVIDLLRDAHAGNLADLSAPQFKFVSELQCETVHQENAITEEMSAWQDGAGEILGGDVEERLRGLVEIVKKADELRFETMRKVVEKLSAQQAVEFIVAAAELVFGFHSWGVGEDYPRRVIYFLI